MLESVNCSGSFILACPVVRSLRVPLSKDWDTSGADSKQSVRNKLLSLLVGCRESGSLIGSDLGMKQKRWQSYELETTFLGSRVSKKKGTDVIWSTSNLFLSTLSLATPQNVAWVQQGVVYSYYAGSYPESVKLLNPRSLLRLSREPNILLGSQFPTRRRR